MAEILQFLTQHAHRLQVQKQSPLIRPNISDYEMVNNGYRLPLGKLKHEGGDMQQFNLFYYKRLEQLRPAVKEAAELRWHGKIDFVDNILDLKTGRQTVIIGTLFKEQKKKPCVLTNLLGTIRGMEPLLMSVGTDVDFLTEKDYNGLYVSEDDQAILEDSSGRINLKLLSHNVYELVTGSIMAILGEADQHGYFEVKDLCYAGIPFQSDLPPQVNNMT
jgi:DNA polymerase delta subunit 2